MIKFKRVFVRDKEGNLVYPPPKFIPGTNLEISQLPLYFYMPEDDEPTPDHVVTSAKSQAE